MQQVISREKEPITPFLERARNLYERASVSTILVAGSSGAFFYIADHVIQMDNYHPVEITEKVGQKHLIFRFQNSTELSHPSAAQRIPEDLDADGTVETRTAGQRLMNI